MTPREYQELHDSFNLFDEKMGFLQLSQSTNDMVSEEVRNFGEQRTDHRRRRSATSLEVGSVHNNSQRKSFPVNEHRGKRRTGRKSTGQSTKNNTTNESPARRRDRSTSNSRDRSNSNSRDRSTSTTRSGGSSKIRGRSSSVANKRNSHSRQNSKSSLSTKKTASKSPKRSSSKEHTNTTIPKPSLQRNKSGPGRLQDSSKNLDYNDANEEEEEEEEEVPPRLSSSKRVSSSSSSNKKNRGRSRKQRSSLPANEPRSGPKKVPPEASPSPSVRKSKNTALHLFDRSVGSEESFFAEEDDPTRRLVKEAGYLEASEYISNSRSVSQSRAKRDDKNNNNASSSTMRSVSLSRKKDHSNNNTSASSLRSGSLSRKKDDRNNTSSSTLRSGSLSRKKDDRNNNTSSSTLRSGSVSRNSVSRNNTSSSTLRSASQSRAKRDDKNSTSASSLRSASLSRAKREDRNHSSASSFRSQSLSRAKREDRNHSSASSLRSQSLSRAKNEDKNNTSASTLKSGSITTGSKEASRNDEDDFKIIRSASLSRPKGVDDYKDDKNKKRSSSIMSRRRESAKSSKDENDSSGNNPKSTAPRKKESSGKTKNNNNNNKSLKRIGTYFPKNEPRGGLVRRRSFTDASSILIFDDEDASIMSDERSVGTRQTILDILASPTTSRPKLSFPIQRRVPSQPHPEHLKRKSRTATAKGKTRSSSKSKRKSRAQGNMPTAVPMTPSHLPNLLAPHSDDEHEDGHDSHKNLLENISISDIMSPVKSKNLLERIAKDAALALTDRWHTVPVGATPAPETSGKNSANNNSNGENSPEPFVGFKNNDDTQDETEEEAVPPVRAGSAAEREARRRSRRERIKEKTGGGEVRKRRSENVTSPKRRERKHSDAMMSKSDTHFSVRRRSTAPSAGQRRQSASRSRSRSNSRSLSRSARLRPRNSLAANPEEQANFHRRAESIFTPKLDNDDTGGESDVSDRMEHEIKPEPPRRTSLLTMQTLYGGGRVETGVAEKDDSEQGERGKRSASLGPTRNSQRKLPVEEDLDVAQHSGSRMLSSVSDTGYRMRTASTGRASRRRLFDSSGALDTEAVKRGGRNRLAKERKSRTSSSDLENDFNKSDMELSHESASTLKSNAGSRGSNKSGSTHHQNQRRRRHTVAKDQLHKSISTIPDLEPMEEEALVAASAHSKAQKLDSISEQVWQRRRRASSVGRDEI